MIHEFTKENIEEIARILNAEPKKVGDDVLRLEIVNNDEDRKLALEIHLGLEAEGEKVNMVSVYAQSTFMQLHNCTAFVASDTLNQVTFFGKEAGRVTGLIVEREAGCSLYANVNETILNTDFTQLPEDMMMCAVALALTETADFGGFSFDDESV